MVSRFLKLSHTGKLFLQEICYLTTEGLPAAGGVLYA